MLYSIYSTEGAMIILAISFLCLILQCFCTVRTENPGLYSVWLTIPIKLCLCLQSCAQYQSLGRSSSTPTPPQVITATADAWQYQQMMQYHLGAVQQQQQQSGSPLHHRLVQFHPHSQLSVDVVGGPCKDQQQQQQSVVLGQSDVDSMAWSPAKQTSGS